MRDVVVIGALFAGMNIGGMMNNTSPSCMMLGQLSASVDRCMHDH